MRILYYSAHPNLSLDSPSGPGTHMREMIGAFKSAGHKVEVLVAGSSSVNLNGSNESHSHFLKKSVKKLIPKILWETLKDLRMVRHDKKCAGILAERIKEFNPDLIYERGYYLMSSGVDNAKKNGVVHFLEMNAPYLEEKQEMSGSKVFCKQKQKQ